MRNELATIIVSLLRVCNWIHAMADPRVRDGVCNDFLVYDGGIWLPPTQPLDEVDAADNFVNLVSSDGLSASNACVNDVGIADAGFCNLN
jgi:hypothetical protein